MACGTGARKSTVNLAGRRWRTCAVLRMVNGNVMKGNHAANLRKRA
nr:MAG TPA: hypothetical protein [Caudoviricetes sp.]